MFLDIYERIVLKDNLGDKSSKREYLSDESFTNGLKICRFCGKQENETKFDKSSHTISEMIGNKRLFSIYECKKCNHTFGEICEDSFGKYIFPFKIVSQIYGKKNTMCYSEQFGEIRMNKSEPIIPDFDDEIRNLIKETKQNNIVTMTNYGFDLTLKRQKYTPEWVYFSLLKMALSILPYKLLNKYAYTTASMNVALNYKDERKEIFNKFVTPGAIEFIPGTNYFKEISAELFIRKNGVLDSYPLCYFSLNFGHYSLQIPLPEDSQRNRNNLKILSYQHFENSSIEINRFHTYEENFVCQFTADKKELSQQNIELLENILFNSSK